METGLGALAVALFLALVLATLFMLTKRNSAPTPTIYNAPVQGPIPAQTSIGQPPTFCAHCGTTLSQDGSFCPNCGAKQG